MFNVGIMRPHSGAADDIGISLILFPERGVHGAAMMSAWRLD